MITIDYTGHKYVSFRFDFGVVVISDHNDVLPEVVTISVDNGYGLKITNPNEFNEEKANYITLTPK